MHPSPEACPHLPSGACLASGEAWSTATSPPFCLCNSFLPPIGHSFVPGPSRRRPPLSRLGPLGPARQPRPTHFLCRPNPAPTRGGKFLSSRRAAPSLSFPAGQESPKRVGRGVELQASGQRGEVTRPHSHNQPRDQAGAAWNDRQIGDSARVTRVRTLAPPSLFQLGVSGTTCWRSAGQHFTELPLIFPPLSQAVKTQQC